MIGHIVALGAQAIFSATCNIFSYRQHSTSCAAAGVVIHELLEPFINTMVAQKFFGKADKSETWSEYLSVISCGMAGSMTSSMLASHYTSNLAWYWSLGLESIAALIGAEIGTTVGETAKDYLFYSNCTES